MKRSHERLERDDDFFFDAGEDELQDRLRHVRPTFDLRPGESAFEIEDAKKLRDRENWTRGDGTLMTKDKNGKIVRLVPDEEEYGPAFRDEEFRRREIVNKDPRIAFFRLLAGCTYRDVESLFDHQDIDNQRRYDDELREWNKLERQRLMVGSDTKKLQLDIVESRFEILGQRRTILEWSHRFVDRFTEDMRFLLVPGVMVDSDNAASLPLCYLIKEQYNLAHEIMQALVSAEEEVATKKTPRDAKRVDIRRFRDPFERYFTGPVGELFEHEFADGFLQYAKEFISRGLGALTLQEMLQFALSIYKYLYTRDEHMPEFTMVKEEAFSFTKPIDGRVAIKRRKVTTREIVYDTSKELYFLYLRNQAVQLYFVKFQKVQPGGVAVDESDDEDDDKKKKKKKKKGKKPDDDDDGSYHVAQDDSDFFRKYEKLQRSLALWQDRSKELQKKGEDSTAIKEEIEMIQAQMSKLTSSTAGRYENILEAVNTPMSEESFKKLFRDTPQKERLLQIIGDELKALKEPETKAWFQSMGSPKPSKKLDFMRSDVTTEDDVRNREAHADVIATTASLIEEVTYKRGAAEEDFFGDSITGDVKHYIAAGMLFSVNTKYTIASDGNTVHFNMDGTFVFPHGFKYLSNLLTTRRGGDTIHVAIKFGTFADQPVKSEMKNKVFEMVKNPVKDDSTVLDSLKGLFRNRIGPQRIANLKRDKETAALIASSSLNTKNGLDHYNVVFLDTGYEVNWDVDLVQLKQLDYLTSESKIMETAIDNLIEPLLSGSLVAIALFAYHEKTIDYFEPAALEIPLAAYTSFLASDANIDETKKFLSSLDKGMGNIKPTRTNKESIETMRKWERNELAQLLALRRHPSIYLLLYLLSWERFAFPGERDELDAEMKKVENVIRDAEAELYRLAMGGTLSVKDQRDKVKALYTPTARWQTRVENTGRVNLEPAVVIALDESLTLVRREIDTLRGATLDALMMSDLESGLPGAFARLVGALMNRTQLVWPQTYNKDMQYRIDPGLRQSCLNNLRGYSVTQLPDGRYKAERVHELEWRQPSAAMPGPIVSVVFL